MPFPTLFTMMLRFLLLVHTVAFLRMKEYRFSRNHVRPQMHLADRIDEDEKDRDTSAATARDT